MEQEVKQMKEGIADEEKSTIKYDQKVEEWKVISLFTKHGGSLFIGKEQTHSS